MWLKSSLQNQEGSSRPNLNTTDKYRIEITHVLIIFLNKSSIKRVGNTVSSSSLVGCGERALFSDKESRDRSSLAGAVQKHSKYGSRNLQSHQGQREDWSIRNLDKA